MSDEKFAMPGGRIFYKSSFLAIREKACSDAVNRVCDMNHISEIYASIEAQVKKGKEPIINDTIVIADVKGEYFVLDGGHRLKVCEMLYNNHKVDASLCVEERKLNSHKKLDELFKQINMNKPMTQIPRSVQIRDVQSVVSEFKNNSTLKLFSETDSPSKCNIPSKKFEKQIGILLEEYIKRYPANATAKLIEHLSAYNEELCEMSIDELQKKYKLDKKSTDRAKKYREKHLAINGGIYFGIVPDLFLHLIKNVFSRIILSIDVQRSVWEKFYGCDSTGKCLFCDKEINAISSDFAEDKLEHDNSYGNNEHIYPCCSTCDLKVDSYITFIQRNKK